MWNSLLPLFRTNLRAPARGRPTLIRRGWPFARGFARRVSWIHRIHASCLDEATLAAAQSDLEEQPATAKGPLLPQVANRHRIRGSPGGAVLQILAGCLVPVLHHLLAQTESLRVLCVFQVTVAKVKELAQLIKLSRKTVAYTGAGSSTCD